MVNRNVLVNCEWLAGFHTLNEVHEDIDMEGSKGMPRDDADQRLTKTQLEIRARNDNLPKHLRRSIDRYRVALGMVPLWGSSLERERQRR